MKFAWYLHAIPCKSAMRTLICHFRTIQFTVFAGTNFKLKLQ